MGDRSVERPRRVSSDGRHVSKAVPCRHTGRVGCHVLGGRPGIGRTVPSTSGRAARNRHPTCPSVGALDAAIPGASRCSLSAPGPAQCGFISRIVRPGRRRPWARASERVVLDALTPRLIGLCSRRTSRCAGTSEGVSEQRPLLRLEPVHQVSRRRALVGPPFGIVDTSGPTRREPFDDARRGPAASAASLSRADHPPWPRARGRSATGYFLSFLVAERRALRDMRRRADLVGRRVLPELRGIGLLGGPAQGRGPPMRRYRRRVADPSFPP
jgi:hypothetical protein